MKKLAAIILSVFFLNNLSYSEEKCSDLDLSKDSIEYAYCIGNKAKEGSKIIINKLNTESKLTERDKETLIK